MHSGAFLSLLLLLGTVLEQTSARYTSEETHEKSKSSYNAINTVASNSETIREQHKHTYENLPEDAKPQQQQLGLEASELEGYAKSTIEKNKRGYEAAQISNTKTGYNSGGGELSAIAQGPLPSTAHKEELDYNDYARPKGQKASHGGYNGEREGSVGYVTNPSTYPSPLSPRTSNIGSPNTGYSSPPAYGSQTNYPLNYGASSPYTGYGPPNFYYNAPPGYAPYPNFAPPAQPFYPSYPYASIPYYPSPPQNLQPSGSGGYTDRSQGNKYPYEAQDTRERDRSSHHKTRDGHDHHNDEHHNHGHDKECGRRCNSGYEGNHGYSTVDHNLKTTSEYKETGHQEAYSGYGGAHGGYGGQGSSNNRNDGGYNGMFNRPSY